MISPRFLAIALVSAAIIIGAGCAGRISIALPPSSNSLITGDSFYAAVSGMSREDRENFALKEILSGNIPDQLRHFSKIRLSITDSSGSLVTATVFVTADYLSIGQNANFARIPLTPMTATLIAEKLHCILPTKKICDAIYEQARIKLNPVPMYAYRDSSITFWQHNLIIEGQRKGRAGLIAGIKKDVISHGREGIPVPTGKVAIYGWHLKNGEPIQPVYTGHVNWYVDYSHGIRLVYRKILVSGKWVDYNDAVADSVLRKLFF